jgi:hypothetical protein
MASPSRSSIKGAVLTHLVEDVNRLRELGRISDEDLEARLEAEDLELLGKELLPVKWYPIDCYRRLTEVLLDIEGFGSKDFLHRRGQAVAERLIKSGIYQQMDQLKSRANEAASIEEYTRRAKLTASIYGAVFNFTSWKVMPDPAYPERVQIEVTEAEDYPEVLRYSTEGFLCRTTQERGSGVAWFSERPEPGRILFRMTRDYDG